MTVDEALLTAALRDELEEEHPTLTGVLWRAAEQLQEREQ